MNQKCPTEDLLKDQGIHGHTRGQELVTVITAMTAGGMTAVMTAITVTAGLQNNRPQNTVMRIKVRSLLRIV